MAVTLVNVRTNSEQTVSPDRIELLTGTDLVSLHNATDVFDILAKANRKERNTFKAGDMGANYRYYSLPEVNEEPCKDNLPDEDMITEIDTNAPTCHMNDPDRPIRPKDQEEH